VIFVFRNETHRDNIDSDSIFAWNTWMYFKRGEGEEEIENHGRSRVIVSSQGTDFTGQWLLRMRARKANQETALMKQLSAGCTTDSNSTPLFSSLNILC
jgi:hypothetical protein